MAQVYLAEDSKLRRQVAVKVPLHVPGHPQLIQRFLDEARHASSLQHANIVQIYDCGECEDGRPFVVMEYIHGTTLSTALDNGPLPVQRCCEILDGLLAALEAAHEKDLVHRDIKPGNIMLDTHSQVKVLDFGLSKHFHHTPAGPDTRSGEDLTPPGEAVGTPRYMSPDQLRGRNLDARSDLFAAGAVFYECLTGRPAFSGATVRELTVQILESDPPKASRIQPGIGREFDAFLEKAMAKHPEGRFACAAEMRAALGTLRVQAPRRPWRRWIAGITNSPRRAAIAAAVAVLLPLLAWIWFTSRGHRPPPEAERFYLQGVDAIRDATPHSAVLALERALAADTVYPAARLRLAEARADLDYLERAQADLLRALGAGHSELSRLDQHFAEALRLRLSRDFAGAVRIHRRIVDAAGAQEKPRVLTDLARALDRNEQPAEALAQYREASRLDPAYPAAYLGIASLLVRRQELAAAESALDKADSLYRALSNSEGVGEVLYRRANLAVTARDTSKAREHAQSALDRARSTGSLYQEISSLLLLSDISHRAGQTDLAERQALGAIDLARRNAMATLVARGLVSLGNAWLVRGDYTKARSVLLEAREHARNHDQQESAAKATLALASVANQLGQPAEVLSLAGEAEQFYRRGGYRLQLSNALLLRSRALRNLGEFDASLQTAGQQLQLANELGNDSLAALAQETRAGSFYSMERYWEALGAARAALALNRKLNHRVGIGYTLLWTANSLSQLGDFQNALEAIAEIESIAGMDSSGMVGLRRQALLARAELELRRNKPAAALALLHRANALSPESPSNTHLLLLARIHTAAGSLTEARRSLDPLLADPGNPVAQTQILQARLADALSLLRVHRFSDAHAAAAALLPAFEQHGQLDSAWRSALLLAASAKSMQNLPAAAAAESRAAALLSRLTADWPPNVKRSFIDRPDLVSFP
jgi:tetratricopeptide (TPR) repeat protein